MQCDYSFYLIVDDGLCEPKDMPLLVSNLLSCGVTCVQLRMKQTSVSTIASIGKSLLALLKPKKIPFIMNDHVEIAADIQADGVHLGQQDWAYAKARHYLGHDKIIGLSIENLEQAQVYGDCDADYFGVGPVFPTTTKRDASPPVGIAQLNKIIHCVNKPIVAIGGINKNNATMLLTLGVDGLAFASAVLLSPHPEEEAKTIARTISLYREEHA
jgi:thiamine-phosphate pyrophosphorylase